MYNLGVRLGNLYGRFVTLTRIQKLKIAYFLLGAGLAIAILLLGLNLSATNNLSHRTATQTHQVARALKDYENFGIQRRSLNNENLEHIKVIVTDLSADFKAACRQTEKVNRGIRFVIDLAVTQSHTHPTSQQKAEINLILHQFQPVNCKRIPAGVKIDLKK